MSLSIHGNLMIGQPGGARAVINASLVGAFVAAHADFTADRTLHENSQAMSVEISTATEINTRDIQDADPDDLWLVLDQQ